MEQYGLGKETATAIEEVTDGGKAMETVIKEAKNSGKGLNVR